MKYTETHIYTSSQGTEPVTALLMSHGIENFSVDDPRDIKKLIEEKENADWDFIDQSLIKDSDEVIITFYTEDNEAGANLLQQIKLDLMKLKSDEMYGDFGKNSDFGRLYVESNPLNDDWKELWKVGVKPFHVTESIVIKPTWEDYEQNIDELVIEIDPVMAFGTGSHETTSSCIRMLEQAIEPGCSVLDIGTGTGILSIVSALCGASEVEAFEIDDTACEVAEANAKINKVNNVIHIICDDYQKEETDKKYDIIVSNLTSNIIIELLPQIKKNLKDGGSIILAGMLAEEQKKMLNSFDDNNLTVKEEIIDGEWYSVRI